MTVLDELPDETRTRIEEATRWRLRLRQQPAMELSAEYAAWTVDPRNIKTYQAVEESLAALDDVASAPEILEMRQSALRNARSGLNKRRPLGKGFLARVAAVVVLLGGAGWLAFDYVDGFTAYTTGVGERKTVALSDGSRILLDSDSEVRVQLSADARNVVLDRGRARFDVAHDVNRPFSVAAGTETVVAVGTSFDVERLGREVLVTLIQGRVVVKGDHPPAGSPRRKTAVSLNAGQQLIAVSDVAPQIETANLQVTSAWEAGRLVFHNESLAEAVERMNRYTERPIIVDPSVASIPINGVFNAGDVGAFVSAVTGYFPVQASTDADDRIVLQSRS